MLRIISILLLFLISAGQVSQTGAGRAVPAAPAPSYTGPGDVVAGATAWWGLRAYTNALANAGASTTPVIDVLGTTTATGCTIYLLGNGTGGLDLTTAGAGGVGNQCLLGATHFCTVTNASCTVSKIYDQTGALSCTSTACDQVQNDAANQAALIFPGGGCSAALLPCLQGSSTSAYETGIAIASVSQPWTVTAVANVVTESSYATVIASDSSNQGLYFNSGNADLYVGGDNNTAISSSTWYTVVGVAHNAGSSKIILNGSSHAITPLATAFAANTIAVGGGAGGSVFQGYYSEFGLWPSDASAVGANMDSYWGP